MIKARNAILGPFASPAAPHPAAALLFPNGHIRLALSFFNSVCPGSAFRASAASRQDVDVGTICVNYHYPVVARHAEFASVSIC
jgi:hypothetical protein